MNTKNLSQSNPFLKDKTKAKKLLLRSIASSTAIETGESIKKIEEKLNRSRSVVNRVKLA
jgi:transposase